ncbi:tRNA lysidine(34) synthetase TilS [Myxococcota bacterium]|nr:tRNA lysidine(34) synthetase TilS [Myxococcota bacterium]
MQKFDAPPKILSGTRVVEDACNSFRFELFQKPILVAVSGGLDSTVLGHCLSRLPGMVENMTLAHVNHHLRGNESEEDEAFVLELAQRLRVNVEFANVYPEVRRLRETGRLRSSSEEAARDCRHDALNEMASAIGARLVFAQHANDQAETILLRLLRGTSPDSLRGMTKMSKKGRILRPLLGVLKEDIEEYAVSNGLQWREDSSNRDMRFTRNLLREKWLPDLANAFNPQLVRALGRFGDLQGSDREYFEVKVGEAYFELVRRSAFDGFVIDSIGFKELHDSLATRLVAKLFEEAGISRELTRVHVTRAINFLRDGSRGKIVEFPLGWKMEKNDRGICFRNANEG